MKERSALAVVADALSEAEENLVGLPSTPEVRSLQRFWYALRTVVHGLVNEHVSRVTAAQKSKLIDRALAFADEVARVRCRLKGVACVRDPELTCVDCGKTFPPSDEAETVTNQRGWRLSRTVADGVVIVELRCPDCYARSRASLPPSASRSSRRCTSRSH
jgi:hypothetical protein